VEARDVRDREAEADAGRDLSGCRVGLEILGAENLIRALEVQPPEGYPDRGCVVVCPDGKLYELAFSAVPGPPSSGALDAVEELRELELAPDEYRAYARQAIHSLASRLKRQ
jgi:hypothetical protein